MDLRLGGFGVKLCRSPAVQQRDGAGLPRESPDNPHWAPPDAGRLPHDRQGQAEGWCHIAGSYLGSRLQKGFSLVCSSLATLMHLSLNEIFLL